MMLKPCPFCGSEDLNRHVDRNDINPLYLVICNTCGAQGPAKADPIEGLEVWNARPGEDTYKDGLRMSAKETGEMMAENMRLSKVDAENTDLRDLLQRMVKERERLLTEVETLKVERDVAKFHQPPGGVTWI